MAYSTPTATEFKTRYPEFSAVGDATVNAMIAEAELQVGSTWIEDDRRPAVMALAAHWMVLEGEPTRTTSGGSTGGGTSTSEAATYTVGDVTTKIESGSGTTTSTTTSTGSVFTGVAYTSTIYGQRYLQLLRRSFPAVVVV